MGWGTSNTMVNVVVSDSAKGNGSIISFLHMFFSVGGFAAPFVAGFLFRLGLGWQYNVILVAGMSAILLPVFLSMPVDTGRAHAEKGRTASAFLSDKRFYIFMCILFFYVGAENSINGWLVTYLINSGIMNEAGAQNTLSVMWVSIIIGRFLCTYISRLIRKETLLLLCCCGGLLFFTLFLVVKNPVLITLCVFAVGLSIAGIYPTSVANAGYIVSSSSAAGGILLSCGGLGASVVPFVAGILTEKFGIGAMLLTIVVSILFLLASAILNLLAGKNTGVQTD
jgi:fucose permease